MEIGREIGDEVVEVRAPVSPRSQREREIQNGQRGRKRATAG
jgi:hypothetical protein